ncbi:MAG: GIY-YIG nuclease family protein [Candidatus Micrarchaeota archaeon]
MEKQHILDEIKRTTRENKGKPLGKARFLAETGIKNSDWFGKYWIRWGDALQEAGFSPNKLQGAYSEDILLEKVCLLIRELGHFPVSGELRLKAHQDSSFPSATTFSRFGNKQSFAKKIIAFCEPRKRDDIIKICDSIIGLIEPLDDEATKQKEEEVGFVYLIKSGKYYKIGRTNSIGRREWELALQLPEKAKLIHSIKTDDPTGIEAYWHKRFEAKRANGEWFDLSATDVSSFRRRKFM